MIPSTDASGPPTGQEGDPIRSSRVIGFQLSRWFTILLLGVSVLLVAGHYTFGEWIFHPKLALWRERAFWWDSCKLLAWPAAFWSFWTVASWGRIRSARVILVAAGTLVLGDCVWYSVAQYLRFNRHGIPADYWHWWTYWALAVAVGANVFLALQWFKLFLHRSVHSATGVTAPQRRSWLRALTKSAVLTIMMWVSFFVLIYAGLPHLEVNDWTLTAARDWLVRAQLKEDFDFLADNWRRQWDQDQVAALLDNVKLSHLQCGQFYSNLDKSIYQNYILSPEIDVLPLPESEWRRTLWEYLYPMVNHLNSPEAAAQIVVRSLRERVGISPAFSADVGVLTIWREGFTNEKGFDRIYVAALRAVGIAARLNGEARAELWNGKDWEPAPRPSVTSFLQGESH